MLIFDYLVRLKQQAAEGLDDLASK